ncbi:hypothetical protein Enr13x_50150 [Stieleria neptunia]|uniref:Uncharacterized protein n=1 Tax=Stieleria neptunia TaxID=2527979 RepID=A0A518HWC5_9BACT|nr:hypothetical protein Enr13x_50150 [Stieleria neptunia]
MFHRIWRMDNDDLGGILANWVTDVQNGIVDLRGSRLRTSRAPV